MTFDGKTSAAPLYELPRTLVGHRAARGAINALLGEAKEKSRGHIPPVMLIGPRGVGKSYLASLIAASLGAEEYLIYLTGFASEREFGCFKERLASFISEEKRVAVVGTLEDYLMSDGWQSYLCEFLKDYYSAYEKGECRAEITLILVGRTDEFAIDPLKELCAERLFLEGYSRSELAEIAAAELDNYGKDYEDEVALACAARSLGSVSNLKYFTKSLFTVSVTRDADVISRELAERFFIDSGIDSYGLGERHRMILRELLSSGEDGVTLESISMLSHIIDFIVEDELVAPLIALGLAEGNDPYRLTEKGRAHILSAEKIFTADEWFI